MRGILILVVGVVAMACSSGSPKENPVLVEANRVHQESEVVMAEIKQQIGKLDSLGNILKAKQPAQSDSMLNVLAGLKTDFKNWDKEFFEVPGFEHAHTDEHEHHHHSHIQAPDLPADKMLELQTEIKANIMSLKTRMNDAQNEVQRLLQQPTANQ